MKQSTDLDTIPVLCQGVWRIMAALFLESSAKAGTCSIFEKPFMPVLTMHGSIDVSVWDDRVAANQTQVNAVRHTSPLDFHYVTLNNPWRKSTRDCMDYSTVIHWNLDEWCLIKTQNPFFIDKKCCWMFLWVLFSRLWGLWIYYRNQAASEINFDFTLKPKASKHLLNC